MKICRSFATVLLFTLFIIPAVSPAWQGKVVKVSDGDTIEVLHNGIAEKIRLYGIDCPEKKHSGIVCRTRNPPIGTVTVFLFF